MGGINASEDSPFKYYRYDPSIPAAGLFIALFILTTTLHTYQFIRTRTWIMLPLVLGGFCEWIGYIGRILSSNESPDFTMGPFLLQNMLLLLAPALFAATIYMSLGRIVRATGGEAYCIIRPKWLTSIFVACDISGLAIQGIGAGVMTAGTLEDYHMGEKIVIAGLALLVAAFGLFVVLAVVYDMRMKRAPTVESKATKLDWRRDLRALYVASALIFARSVVRLVEFSQGNDGWLLRHEWTLFVFDSIPMWAVMVLFNVVHMSHAQALLNGGRYSELMGLRIREAGKPVLEGEEKV
ncbi:MAG: hypothetical protein MMC23_003382 [Stictis urceolatum]|nr:hypothetical protein [Stictis urceolata]